LSVVFVTCHSILDLSLRHQVARRALIDPQLLHKLVMSGFYGWVEDGAADPRAQLQVLHTSSTVLTEDRLTVVVQSRVQPDWSRIPVAALLDKPETITIDHRIESGQDYTFRVVVSPTRDTYRHLGREPRPGDARKRRTETDPQQVRSWIAERLQPAGEPPISQPRGIRRIGADGDAEDFDIRMLPVARSVGDHPGQQLGRAEIRGEITVTDPPALLDAMVQGIGRSRALGCGLLLAKPAKG
jgi:CRISPR system Cascade subunit CasE